MKKALGNISVFTAILSIFALAISGSFEGAYMEMIFGIAIITLIVSIIGIIVFNPYWKAWLIKLLDLF